ncbi:hypothetical protein Bca4012_006974 [Brassica carinata]|uniref:Uncharacterized protein n=1 Tax=Brassica carinata TaxID=52824 RepID=A0A8X7RQK8_BRACI|nr:hypothetical protein Bca52824_037709 [Brassica carinata]
MLWRLEKEKKKTKVLTTISKKLYLLSSIGFSHDPDDGLVAEIQNKTISNTGEAVKLALLQSAAAPTTFPSTVNHGWTMKTVEAVPKVGLALKRVEVFSEGNDMHETIQLACKCMGKYQDGPNVRVVNDTDNVMTDSDVETTVTSFFAKECRRESLEYVSY